MARSPHPPATPAVAADTAVARVALRLGQAGLLPFAIGAGALWRVDGDWQLRLAAALLAYGAVIVSFLGGIHWGLALRQVAPRLALFGWGVVPSLLAWPALLLPAPAGLVLLGGALLACYAVDRRAYPVQGRRPGSRCVGSSLQWPA